MNVPEDRPSGPRQRASPYYTPPGKAKTGAQASTVLFDSPKTRTIKGGSFLGSFFFGPKMMNPKKAGHQPPGLNGKGSPLVRSIKGHKEGGATLKTGRTSPLKHHPTPLLGGTPPGGGRGGSQGHLKVSRLVRKPAGAPPISGSLKRQRTSPRSAKRQPHPSPALQAGKQCHRKS